MTVTITHDNDGSLSGYTLAQRLMCGCCNGNARTVMSGKLACHAVAQRAMTPARVHNAYTWASRPWASWWTSPVTWPGIDVHREADQPPTDRARNSTGGAGVPSRSRHLHPLDRLDTHGKSRILIAETDTGSPLVRYGHCSAHATRTSDIATLLMPRDSRCLHVPDYVRQQRGRADCHASAVVP